MESPTDVIGLYRIVNRLMQSKFKTRDGRKVRLTRFEIWDDAPFHGIIEGDEDRERYWISDGRALVGDESPIDLFIGDGYAPE